MSFIAIFDYGLGNVTSIKNAFDKLGVKAKLTNNVQDLRESSGMVFPGVGSFSHAMEVLVSNNYVENLIDYANTGKPILGICLGMQLLMTYSEENGYYKGLNIIPGCVKKVCDACVKIKLPHVGWACVKACHASQQPFEKSIISNLDNQKQYFVHSYAVKPDNDSAILATVRYANVEVVSAIQDKNVIGVQFHPERSGASGLEFLKNFSRLTSNKEGIIQ